MPVLPSPKLLLFFVSLSFSKTKRAKALQIFVEHVESYSIFFSVLKQPGYRIQCWDCSRNMKDVLVLSM